MERKNKELYEIPSTTVFDVKFEGVICTSLNPVITLGNPFENTPDEEDW